MVDGVEFERVTTEPEWDPFEVDLLIAAMELESEYGPHGMLMSEVTDPRNQFKWVGHENPLTDYYEKARLDVERAYYDKYDTPSNPVNRHGLIFRVRER